jgi:hypothetical protein
MSIKVSAGRFTERFEREGRAIAALNEPNVHAQREKVVVGGVVST